MATNLIGGVSSRGRDEGVLMFTSLSFLSTNLCNLLAACSGVSLSNGVGSRAPLITLSMMAIRPGSLSASPAYAIFLRWITSFSNSASSFAISFRSHPHPRYL